MTGLAELITRHVAQGTVPGAVGLLGRAGSADADVVVAGSATLAGDVPLRADAIFRIQSMTKAVTTVAALQLVEAGRLSLEEDVTTWLPELADRRVLVDPAAALDDTVAAPRAITLRDLLTNASGYGSVMDDSPIRQAMIDNGTEAGPEPVGLGADEWISRLAELPLMFAPGAGWRYHQSFGLLGILLSRLTGGFVGDHLAAEVFGPLGMVDTAYWVPADKLDRLPAAVRADGQTLVEIEPAAGGFYAGPPPYDVSHAELVSTAADYYRFARALADGRLISADHYALMTTDQTRPEQRTPDSFFPGFWEHGGWGFGVGVSTDGPHAGRFGWSGGLGTTFFVDPDGTVAILLTQLQMGDRIWPLLGDFEDVGPS